MADITTEIPTVEDVLTRAAATSDVSTIVSEALERRSSNSSVAAFSPFIVADVKNVNDVPEVSMTESVYNALRDTLTTTTTEVLAPTDDNTQEVTTHTTLPDSTESSVDGSNADATIGTSDRDDISESDSVAVSEKDDTPCEHSDENEEDNSGDKKEIPINHCPREIADTIAVEEEESDSNDDEVNSSDTESDEEENTIHSDNETEKPVQHVEAQIPAEIMFLLLTVLILNSFNFLMTLTGARQCIRPF